MASKWFQYASRFAGGKPPELRSAVVAGGAAATNIAVAGIGTEDVLVSVVELGAPEEAAGTPAATDRTAQATVPSNGNIQVSVATNTNAQRRLLVIWFDL